MPSNEQSIPLLTGSIQVAVSEGDIETGGMPGIEIYVMNDPNNLEAEDVRLPTKAEWNRNQATILKAILENLPD